MSWRAAASPTRSPAGASDHPLGGLGFASWAREVEAQEAELGVFFDTIIVCSVTGSTQAGMVAGFADRPRAGERRVYGIDASAKLAETLAQVARIARFNGEADFGLERDLRDDEIILDDRYHAGIYGIPDESTLAAMRLAAGLEAMITDPVYEGKSMAGMIDLVSPRRDRARHRTCCMRTSVDSRRSAPTRRWCGDDRGRAALGRRARGPRRRAAARAVAGGGDRPPRQPRAPEPLGRQGRRPPGLERVDGDDDDRAVVLVPRGARPRLGQAARLARAARDQLPARAPGPEVPGDAAPVRRAAVLPLAREGPRPGRLLDRLGRDRGDGADLGRDRAPLRGGPLRRPGRRPPDRAAGRRRARRGRRAGRRSRTRWSRTSARCCGSSTSTASRSTASSRTSRRAGSRRCSRPRAGTA